MAELVLHRQGTATSTSKALGKLFDSVADS
jgi:hypothetical protein